MDLNTKLAGADDGAAPDIDVSSVLDFSEGAPDTTAGRSNDSETSAMVEEATSKTGHEEDVKPDAPVLATHAPQAKTGAASRHDDMSLAEVVHKTEATGWFGEKRGRVHDFYSKHYFVGRGKETAFNLGTMRSLSHLLWHRADGLGTR